MLWYLLQTWGVRMIQRSLGMSETYDSFKFLTINLGSFSPQIYGV